MGVVHPGAQGRAVQCVGLARAHFSRHPSRFQKSLDDDLSRIPEVYDTAQAEAAPGIGCFLVAECASSAAIKVRSQRATACAVLTLEPCDQPLRPIPRPLSQGMVGLQARRDLHATAELRRLSVAASEQGRGLGRQLVAALEAWARTHGFQTVVLSTGSVMRAACLFYPRVGYAVAHHETQVLPPTAEGLPSTFEVTHFAKDLLERPL